jgi:hypothetical protein
MGAGNFLDRLRAMAAEFNLGVYVELTGCRSESELLENFSAAEGCADPAPSSPLNEISIWNKVMESAWLMGSRSCP